MSKEILKVKVIKCSYYKYWYKDYIGEVFEVVGEKDHELFKVVHPPKKAIDYVRSNEDWRGELHIQKKDCEDEFFALMRSIINE